MSDSNYSLSFPLPVTGDLTGACANSRYSAGLARKFNALYARNSKGIWSRIFPQEQSRASA